MQLASFDIFDTSLIRKCGKPENVFWLMARQLFPDNVAQQCKFVIWRKNTDNQFSQSRVNYTLEELYSLADVEIIYGRYKLDSSSLCKLEYEIESDMLVANPCVSKTIASYRKDGYSIAYISDMYLSSSFLRTILVREGLFEDGDIIYVSCEKKARKYDGTLFDIVRNDLHPIKWIHFGDNEYSDVLIPKQKGIISQQVFSDYSRIEQKFESCAVGLGKTFDFSILMGYMRYLRLTGEITPENTFAINFIAPLYYAYVKHVIDDASKRGIKTLYFLSRDSYIFLKIAEQIPHDGIDLRYLYVSRKSIQPAFRYISSDEEFKVSIKGTISDIGRQSSDKDSYELLDAYFTQDGLYDDDIALVDLGWFGSTRLMINHIRAFKHITPCFCYYLGVLRQSLPDIYGKYDSFIFSERFANNAWHTYIIEEYFSLCPHPTTLGYKSENGQIMPVFGNEAMTQSGCIDANIKNCCRFAKEIIQIDPSVLLFYGLNSFCSMDNELEKEYTELLFDACRNEEFMFRRLSYRDLIPYIKDRKLTLNDKLAINASFGKNIRFIADSLRRLYVICRSFKNKVFS